MKLKRAFCKINILYLGLALLFASCSSTKFNALKPREKQITAIKFLDEYILPSNLKFKNTIVGGLSGIDYDSKQNQYFMISDDPSQYSPARIYTAKIIVGDYKIDTVQFTDVNFILQENGTRYPKYAYGKNSKADGESVRYNPKNHQLIWSNEGERLYRTTDTTLVQPALTFIEVSGKYIDTIPLPQGFHFTKTENGPRKNALFEGLTYADNYTTLYASLEEPRYEDGRPADYNFEGALTRILKFDIASKKNVAQYAYNLGAIPVKPTEVNSWNVNGISEILSVNNHTLLVMERAWAKGHDDHTFVKIFLVDLADAENQIHNPSFLKKVPKPLKKKLLFDFDSLKMHIDNLEGVTFGPKLPNGHDTLIFIADDNFSKDQKAQVLLFEVIP